MGGIGMANIFLQSKKDNLSIYLIDKNGHARAVLGTTELKRTVTGSTEIRAPSSLVLFNEKGKVAFSAP